MGRREIVADFSGGTITSDGGGLLLREVEKRCGILNRFAKCFTDYRDQLFSDKLLAVMVGKSDPTGINRKDKRDRGKPLAGKSTLNRLKLTPQDADSQHAYKKIALDSEAVDNLFVDLFIESQVKLSEQIILNVDATDDPLHGNKEAKFFHGYYKAYCYLPLYIFYGETLLCARRLRTADNDGAAGTVEELERIVDRIRGSWPDTQIVVRGDSGFCREYIMEWCEDNMVDYVLGLAKNNRL